MGGARGRVGDISEVVARGEEVNALQDLLTDPPEHVEAVVLTGVAGIGKTTLWRYGLTLAQERGFTTLSARPSQSETGLAFAGLADLMRPLPAQLVETLPPPQARALKVALLLEEPDPDQPVADERAVASGFLGVLRVAASKTPVLLAVDDVQWLDDATAAVVAFAARRLVSDQLRFLFAVRTPGDLRAPAVVLAAVEPRAQQLVLDSLSMGALEQLLAEQFGAALSRPVRRRIWEASGGNPLYALQIAHALQRRDVVVRAGEPLPIPGDLQELVNQRVTALPEVTQRVLEVAAAESAPTVSRLSAAVGEGARALLRPAVDEGLVHLRDDELEFMHPLVASTVYHRMDGVRRREVHRALAAAIGGGEERVRHLALAVQDRDEPVAAALEEQAIAVRARGSAAAAGDLSEQAWRLTPPDQGAAGLRRRVLAARYHFESGDAPRARALLDDAVRDVHDDEQRAWVLSRLARIHMYEGDQRRAIALFEEALGHAGELSAARADAEEGLATALYLMRERLVTAAEHAANAVAVLKASRDRSELPAALGTLGLIEGVLGRPEALDTLRKGLEAESSAGTPPWSTDARVMRRPIFDIAAVSLWRDDPATARLHLTAARDAAVTQGDESSLSWLLSYLAMVEYIDGDWDTAARLAADAVEVASAATQRTGWAVALSSRALIRGARGDERVRAEAAEALRLAADQPAMLARLNCAWAIGLLELSLNNAAEAHAVMAPMVERARAAGVGEPGSIRFVTDDVEALIALSRRDEARTLLGWFEERAQALNRYSVLAAAGRCRALLAAAEGRLDEAGASLERALAMHERALVPFDRLRTLLTHGEVLRRSGQKRAARVALDEARAGFDRIGARTWSSLAEAATRRIGGRSSSTDELTVAERRVADLVTQGMTNREVAAALFIAPRTVEYHLSKIYSKLGVRSRGELTAQLLGGHSS